MDRRLFFAKQLAFGVFVDNVLDGCFGIHLLLNQRGQHLARGNFVAGHAGFICIN